MGYKEAVEDGIRMEKQNSTKNTVYFPLCHICEKEIFSLSYLRNKEYTCPECKRTMYFVDRDKRVESNEDIKEQKLSNAIKRIEGSVGAKIKGYDNAIKIVKKNLHRDGWFDSTEEIMVAIELLKNKIATRHQVKFGKYRADFVLPDEKIVLEVDGKLFHTSNTRRKEEMRDNLIVIALGSDWEVIRITDELINQNIKKLVPAIRKVKKEREELRSKNNGRLPYWYTDRESI